MVDICLQMLAMQAGHTIKEDIDIFLFTRVNQRAQKVYLDGPKGKVNDAYAYSLFPKNEIRFRGSMFLSSSVILS